MCARRKLDSMLKEVAKSYREVYGSEWFGIILYGFYVREDYSDESNVY